MYLLWWHLNQYLWFKIPGIACFRAVAQNSEVNHLEGQIYPGQLKINLAPHEDTDPHEMVRQLESDFGYAKEDILDLLNALRLEASAQLEHKGNFELIPFGDLSLEKNVLVFRQSPLNIHREFYGAKPLPVKAVQKIFQPKPFTAVPPVYRDDRKKKTSLNPLFIILGLLWIIFLALLFWPEDKPPVPASQIAAQDSSMLLTAEDSDLIQSIQNKSVDTAALQEEQINQIVVDPDSQEISITADVVDSLNQLVKHKECVIIVGSFIYKPNAERMAQRIEKQNYSVYRGEFGKFNRVGIKFDCMEKDLQQVLSELKQNFNPGAWVLKMDK